MQKQIIYVPRSGGGYAFRALDLAVYGTVSKREDGYWRARTDDGRGIGFARTRQEAVRRACVSEAQRYLDLMNT